MKILYVLICSNLIAMNNQEFTDNDLIYYLVHKDLEQPNENDKFKIFSKVTQDNLKFWNDIGFNLKDKEQLKLLIKILRENRSTRYKNNWLIQSSEKWGKDSTDKIIKYLHELSENYNSYVYEIINYKSKKGNCALACLFPVEDSKDIRIDSIVHIGKELLKFEHSLENLNKAVENLKTFSEKLFGSGLDNYVIKLDDLKTILKEKIAKLEENNLNYISFLELDPTLIIPNILSELDHETVTKYSISSNEDEIPIKNIYPKKRIIKSLILAIKSKKLFAIKEIISHSKFLDKFSGREIEFFKREMSKIGLNPDIITECYNNEEGEN